MVHGLPGHSFVRGIPRIPKLHTKSSHVLKIGPNQFQTWFGGKKEFEQSEKIVRFAECYSRLLERGLEELLGALLGMEAG